MTGAAFGGQLLGGVISDRFDKRLIATPHYANAIKLTSSIGKQANGWRKYANSPASSGPRPC